MQSTLIDLIDFCPATCESSHETIEGLQSSPKRLPSKFFYDERGSRLFDRICDLDEYYVTRTEMGIMREHAGEIAAFVGPRAMIIEYGSGTCLKTRWLLHALEEPAAYAPVEIARDHLLKSVRSLAADFPDVEIIAVCADYTRPFFVPRPTHTPESRVVYFPGSTIGNFDKPEAIEFLRRMNEQVGAEGGILIGVDLKKPADVLLAAYNDSKGVTAEFNRNILVHLNRVIHSDFPVEEYGHEAIYNEEEGRIEMHLISGREHHVSIAEEQIFLKKGERIVTEHSYKYTPEEFAELADEAGLRVEKLWTDPRDYFSVQYLKGK